MTSIKEATPDMFLEVYPLLQEFNRNNSEITRSNWEQLFQNNWKKPSQTLGYLLMDGGTAVGFLGTICSQRVINGQLEDLCNLTSWVVKKEYRSKGISLFMPVLKLKSYTVTILTPAQHVQQFYQKMGFRELERKQIILYPFPQLSRLLSPTGFCGTTDEKIIAKILRGTDLDIFHDHRPYPCRHLVVHHGPEYCYVIFKRTKGRKVHFSEIHYVSHPRIFLENLNRIKMHLFMVNGTFLTLLQSRLVGDPVIPHSKTTLYPSPPLYMSSRLRPEQIDNLYSELMLLSL